MKFEFECDDCKVRFQRWETLKKHLETHPDHAPMYAVAGNIWPKETT